MQGSGRRGATNWFSSSSSRSGGGGGGDGGGGDHIIITTSNTIIVRTHPGPLEATSHLLGFGVCPKSQPMRCKMLPSAFLPLQAATGVAPTLQRDQGQYTSTSKFTRGHCGLAGKHCPRPASGCGNGGEWVGGGLRGGQPLHPRLKPQNMRQF